MKKVFKCERDVKERVKEIFRERKVYYFMPYMAGYGRAGIPDIVACYRGKFLGVECKFGDNKPTVNQINELEAILIAGGEAMVINETNVECLYSVLDNL